MAHGGSILCHDREDEQKARLIEVRNGWSRSYCAPNCKVDTSRTRPTDCIHPCTHALLVGCIHLVRPSLASYWCLSVVLLNINWLCEVSTELHNATTEQVSKISNFGACQNWSKPAITRCVHRRDTHSTLGVRFATLGECIQSTYSADLMPI